MNILAVGAHLDDIEIAAGGLLSDAAKAGHNVYMCVATASAWNDIDGIPDRTIEVAESEGKAASEVIGAKELILLKFPTGKLSDDNVVVSAIEREMVRIKPDVIFTHWPHDTHQDHRAAALATISAARRHNRILMFEPFTPSGRSYEAFRGQAYFRISPEGRVGKQDSLKAHKSQHIKYGEDTWIDAVNARGVLRGYEIGAEFAECFEVLRWDLEFSADSFL
jgi:LmbE family N-acetylglucosaminyl deacetylase